MWFIATNLGVVLPFLLGLMGPAGLAYNLKGWVREQQQNYYNTNYYN